MLINHRRPDKENDFVKTRHKPNITNHIGFNGASEAPVFKSSRHHLLLVTYVLQREEVTDSVTTFSGATRSAEKLSGTHPDRCATSDVMYSHEFEQQSMVFQKDSKQTSSPQRTPAKTEQALNFKHNQFSDRVHHRTPSKSWICDTALDRFKSKETLLSYHHWNAFLDQEPRPLRQNATPQITNRNSNLATTTCFSRRNPGIRPNFTIKPKSCLWVATLHTTDRPCCRWPKKGSYRKAASWSAHARTGPAASHPHQHHRKLCWECSSQTCPAPLDQRHDAIATKEEGRRQFEKYRPILLPTAGYKDTAKMVSLRNRATPAMA